MKKIYNFFLCAIIFSTLNINCLIDNKSKLPLNTYDNNPNDDNDKIAAAVLATYIAAGGAHYVYKNKKYQKAVKELSEKHKQEMQALDVEDQQNLEKLLDNLKNQYNSDEYGLRLGYESEAKYNNDVENLKKEYMQKADKIKFNNGFKKQEKRNRLKEKQNAEIQARVKNSSKNNQQDISGTSSDGQYGMIDEKIADINQIDKDLYGKNLVPSISRLPEPKSNFENKKVQQSEKKLDDLRQVLEKSDTDKQYAEKNLHVSKSIEDDIVKEAFDKNNNLDDKDMNVEFVGK